MNMPTEQGRSPSLSGCVSENAFPPPGATDPQGLQARGAASGARGQELWGLLPRGHALAHVNEGGRECWTPSRLILGCLNNFI